MPTRAIWFPVGARTRTPISPITGPLEKPTGRRSGHTPDGTGLTQGGQTGDGEVTISWTVEPDCAAAPPAPVAPVAPLVVVTPAFTG